MNSIVTKTMMQQLHSVDEATFQDFIGNAKNSLS
jgi:hypothetical protein